MAVWYGALRVSKKGRIGFEKPLFTEQLAGVDFDGGSVLVRGHSFHVEDQQALRDLIAHIAVEAAGGETEGSSLPRELLTPVDAECERWQYAVINIGVFNTSERIAEILGASGSNGWELVTVFDKASSWIGSWEKGFLLMRRRVPPGVEVRRWCIEYRG